MTTGFGLTDLHRGCCCCGSTFMQVGVIAATIAQAGAIGNQRGLSNLQRFEAHYSPTLKGGGDPRVASHCFRLVRKDTVASTKRKKNQSSL